MAEEPEATADDRELELWMHVQAGDFDRAYAVATRLLILGEDPVRCGRVEAALGLMMQRSGLMADSRDQFARAAALVASSPPDRALVLAFGSLSSVLGGDLDRAEREAREADLLGTAHGVEIAVRQARTTLAAVHLGRGDLPTALALATDATAYGNDGVGQGEYRSTAHVLVAMALAELDRMEEAHVAIARGVAIAQEEGDTGQLAWYLASQAMLHFIDGHWADAHDEAARSIVHAERTGALAARPLAWGITACMEGLRGNVTAARGLIAQARSHRLGPGAGLGEEWVALACAAVAEDAEERYDALCDAWFRLRGMPSLLAWKVFAHPLVVLAMARGDRELAEVVSARVGAAAASAGTASARATAQCCAATVAGDPAALAAGLDLLRTAGRPLPLAFGCVAAAQAALRSEDRAAALQEAAAVFHRLGATRWSAEVARLLVDAAVEGVPVAAVGPWHLLSPGECRVVRLAVLGLSNSRIAAELGTSPRTVQTQLASACRKCGVAGRVQLAGLFAAGAR